MELRECLLEVRDVYDRWRQVLKEVTDALDLGWSSTELVARAQDRDLLYKCLLARVGGEDESRRVRLSGEERESGRFPKKIDDFGECHEMCRLLE